MKMASRLIDLISKKKNCTLFLLISKKQICTCSMLFFFPLPLFCTTKTSNFLVIFMEELSCVLTQYFLSCVHVRFYFSLPLIFTLLAASISHFFTAPLNLHVFLATKFVSFVLLITRSSSFSVIHVSVNMKNNAEKDTTMLLFFSF